MTCTNAKCKHHRRDGGGCGLFEGRAWESCRKAVWAAAKAAPAKTKTTEKNRKGK